jgi:serine/threonine protein kinase
MDRGKGLLEYLSVPSVRNSAAYMSPEQGAADRHSDPRSDIYSLGCVVCEMLTGEPTCPGRVPDLRDAPPGLEPGLS